MAKRLNDFFEDKCKELFSSDEEEYEENAVDFIRQLLSRSDANMDLELPDEDEFANKGKKSSI